MAKLMRARPARRGMPLDIGTVWAALASVVATMVVGFLWYGPVLGKPWMRAVGMDRMTPAEQQAAQKAATPGYVTSMVSTLVAVALLDLLVDWAMPGSPYADDAAWIGGTAIAFTAFVAFYVPGTLTAQFFEKRSWVAWAIGTGYWGVLSLVWGAIVGALA